MLTYVELSLKHGEVDVCVSNDNFMANIIIEKQWFYLNINFFKKHKSSFNIICLL